MAAKLRFRDVFRRYTPIWLLDRLVDGYKVGYSTLWAMIAPLDNLLDQFTEGLQAPWPGKGTPTALALIGQTRGIVRGEAESDDSYAARLRLWLDTAARRGSAEAIALELQAYLSTHPMIRVVNRAGFWTTLHTDGTFTYTTAPWNWDTVSNPERNSPSSPMWSDEWIIVYAPPWAVRGHFGDPGAIFGADLGVGQSVTAADYEAILAIVAKNKAAHSNVRAIVWSYDATKFDPTNVLSTMPDGTWGRWGYGDPMVCTRDPGCRYWEPSDIPDLEVIA